mmetsp:Transcript_58116/g.133013  ORF Transcript_58116/g.133013 Transcript_58116/m.133013 type:complete len:208 (+) Transcript_58116:454-1077(+)
MRPAVPALAVRGGASGLVAPCVPGLVVCCEAGPALGVRCGAPFAFALSCLAAAARRASRAYISGGISFSGSRPIMVKERIADSASLSENVPATWLHRALMASRRATSGRTRFDPYAERIPRSEGASNSGIVASTLRAIEGEMVWSSGRPIVVNADAIVPICTGVMLGSVALAQLVSWSPNGPSSVTPSSAKPPTRSERDEAESCAIS